MPRRSGSLVAALLLSGCVLSGLLSGCGAAGQANPEKIGPRGVDELVIPTPDPDPDDFTDAVTNPWLPLVPGTVWTYDVAGNDVEEVEVRVEEGSKIVAGIECVVVHSQPSGPTVRAVGTRRYYAQDRTGNVWLLGERPDLDAAGGAGWMAGVDGALAGIAMLATPRVGDGYVQAQTSGRQDQSTVLALDEQRELPAGTFGGLLVTEDTWTGVTDRAVQRYYAKGVGLVEETLADDGSSRLELRSVTAP